MTEKLIGVEDKIEEVKDWIENFNLAGKKALLLHGEPGTGKTAVVYRVAEDLGKSVVEFNASDDRRLDFLEKLKNAVRSKSLGDSLYLLDEADYVEEKQKLSEILTRTTKPILMTANEPWKLGDVRKHCADMKFFRPRTEDVVKNAENRGVEDMENIMRDQRQAELKKFGSEGYRSETMKDMLEFALTEGDYSGLELDRSSFYWRLLEKIDEFYGRDLYLFVKGLATAQRTGRPQPLNGLKK